MSRRNIRLGAILLALVALPLLANKKTTLPDISIQKSLVKVRLFPVLQSYVLPWIRRPGRGQVVTGVVVAKNRILIRAEDVRSVGLIQVQKYSSYQVAQAKVESLDMESNLALLSITKPGFFDDLLPLATGSDLRVGEYAQSIKINSLFRVFREAVKILDIKIIADFGLTHLPVQTFRSDEAFGSGSILVSNGLLRGMVGFSGKKSELVPASIMDAYRKRTLSSQAAFVSVGFMHSNMIDLSKREHYGLPRNLSGTLVTKVIQGTSAYSHLKKNDIILKIEGFNVDNAGFFQSEKLGKRSVSMLFVLDHLRLRKPGEHIRVEVFRNKKVKKIQIQLIPYAGNSERIPWVVLKKPDYLVESGFVFVELSVPLLRQSLGRNWKSKAIELSKIYKEKQYFEGKKRDKIVLISRVLPDETNRGYQNTVLARITRFDGKKVQSIYNLKLLLKDAVKSKKPFAYIQTSGGQKIVLDLGARDVINKRIARKYRVPTQK